MTWPTEAGSTPARSSTPRWAAPRMTAAWVSANCPPRRPIAVRPASTITGLGMGGSSDGSGRHEPDGQGLDAAHERAAHVQGRAGGLDPLDLGGELAEQRAHLQAGQ